VTITSKLTVNNLIINGDTIVDGSIIVSKDTIITINGNLILNNSTLLLSSPLNVTGCVYLSGTLYIVLTDRSQLSSTKDILYSNCTYGSFSAIAIQFTNDTLDPCLDVETIILQNQNEMKSKFNIVDNCNDEFAIWKIVLCVCIPLIAIIIVIIIFRSRKLRKTIFPLRIEEEDLDQFSVKKDWTYY